MSQESKEIALHAELACTLWSLASETQAEMFCRAKGVWELLGASCSDAQPWQDSLAQEISQLGAIGDWKNVCLMPTLPLQTHFQAFATDSRWKQDSGLV